MPRTVHFIGGWSYSRDQLTSFSGRFDKQYRMVTHPFNVVLREIYSADEPMVLAGWSLGGLRILDAIAAGNIKPTALILISSTFMFCADSKYPHGVNRKALRSMSRGIKNDRDHTLGKFYRDAAKPSTVDENVLLEHLHDSHEFPTEALLDGLTMLDHLDCRTGLNSLTMPTLLLHGARDAIISPEASSYLHAHIPGSSLHIHPDAGHEMLIRQADWTVQHCTDFLNNLMP